MKDISEIVDPKRVEQHKPKLGAGALQAALRQGGKELTPALKAFPDSIDPVEEYGALGIVLPSEALEQKRGGMVHGETQPSTQPQKQLQPDMELEM